MSRNDDIMEKNIRCSFCGKNQHQVGRMISGPGGAFICDECIDICKSCGIEAHVVGRAVEGNKMSHVLNA